MIPVEVVGRSDISIKPLSTNAIFLYIVHAHMVPVPVIDYDNTHRKRNQKSDTQSLRDCPLSLSDFSAFPTVHIAGDTYRYIF